MGKSLRLKSIVTYVVVVISFVCIVGCGDRVSDGDKPAQAGESKTVKVTDGTITATIDKKSATIADTLSLTIAVTLKNGAKPEFPQLDKLGDFTVTRVKRSEPKLLDGDRLRYAATYELEPYLPGNQTIKKVKLIIRDDDGKNARKVESQPFSVTIKSIVADDDKLHGVTSPLKPPRQGRTWVFYVAIGVLTFLILWLVVSFVIVKLLRRRYGTDASSDHESEAIRDPADVAMEAIDALVAENLAEAGKIKEFHLQLSGILRHYVEDRFDIRAPELTTEEFLVELRRSDVCAADTKQTLSNFLNHSDLVKFANLQPSENEVAKAIDDCRTFVERTRENADAI